MKRGVISILGTISCKDYKTSEFDKNKRAIYEVDEKLKDLLTLNYQNYTNMFPIVIENFYNEYDIVPIYTKDSKNIQIEVLKNCDDEKFKNVNEIIETIFDKGIFIENENDFKFILKEIDKKIREYDEVIIDVSHGFRHLPILMTIDLIITSLKSESRNKIKNILFAEEIEKFKEYKIIDLKSYLDLANLAFIINIFKDNYSVSNHIQVFSSEYQKLIDLMRKFSKDLMALSIDNLLENIVPELRRELESLLENDFILFKDEIENILETLNKIYVKKEHRYQTFYYIAEDSYQKGYLAVAISLIFEGVSFYLYSFFRDNSKKIADLFEKLKNNKKLTNYDILDLCRGVFLYNDNKKGIDKFKFRDKLEQYENMKEELFLVKKLMKEKIKFYEVICLLKDSRDLRNNLLHANSGDKIEDVDRKVKELLERYKELLIKSN